ncbi:methyltransferase [Thalassotalea insulae]|uniref:Methyltransferase n=1 Tax=Thalassotalea insulae TaxID=2056778 RepID=A0ABQ6GQN1_9GAMM|nr:class I SAM-dependent methyltransferase [Thalassotalea insulae]GLX78268.1 methyltransferase [Thalassotalea insulae]
MKFSLFNPLVLAFGLTVTLSAQANNFSEQAIKSAVASKDRPATDIAKDEKRQPEQVLRFFNIAPGTEVLDVLAGSGYYSELLANVVGEQGKVIIHNDKHFLKYYGQPLSERLADGKRLTNAERIDISLNDLSLEENSLDTIMLALGYHDFYYVFSEAEKIQVNKVLAKFRKFLKPGGIIGIIDHEAIAGAPASVGGTLHRIDPQLVKNEMTAAGFTLDGELDILKNSTDDKTKKIWDIPGRDTSRFVMRFKNNK